MVSDTKAIGFFQTWHFKHPLVLSRFCFIVIAVINISLNTHIRESNERENYESELMNLDRISNFKGCRHVTVYKYKDKNITFHLKQT